MSLGTVLQNELAFSMPFWARTSTDGPKWSPPSLEAATLIWLAEKSWYETYTWSCAAEDLLAYTPSQGRSMNDGCTAAIWFTVQCAPRSSLLARCTWRRRGSRSSEVT